MAQGAEPKVVPFPEPGHLKTIKRRFLALNADRLARVRGSLKPEQRLFVEVLPLLFHVNHPSLPGFTSKKAPAGIADFSVEKRVVEAAGKLVRKFSYRRRAQRVYNIHGLYMIGSSGTVAYSDTSDFDIWVCHRPGLSESQIQLLHDKCDQVRKWASTLGLDAKFFVIDPGLFRRGESPILTEDSCGSAQHMFLLEEFYRTGLLLAGRYPGWWLVPPERERDHDAQLRLLIDNGVVYDHEFIDFGPVTHIPAEEFFGAALWQLHKAIDSPYKSVLKLLLMEAYASEYPQTDLLCSRFKQAIYDGQSTVDELDPYVLMVRKVEEYLQGRGERDRLDLARKCFYFKANAKLSHRSQHDDSPGRKLLRSLVGEWNWNQDRLLNLDSRNAWKIHRVLDERNSLVDELTRSYRMVSDFARRHTEGPTIESGDLNLLGRRLFAEFERKAGKVDIINPGISTNLFEDRLSFVEVNEHGRQGWILYRGEYTNATTRRPDNPIKRAHSLVELVAWCHFNCLIGPQTLVNLVNGQGALSSRELLAVIDSFSRLFPSGELPASDMHQLRHPAHIVSSALYINLGVDPLSGHTRRGVYLTSNRSDALSYGGIWKNLALTFDLLVVTSWREVLTFRYNGPGALLDCLCDYLAWTPLGSDRTPQPPPVYSFSTARGMAIAHRVEELFRDTIRAFFSQDRGKHARYVVRIEQHYYMLQPENGIPRHQRVPSEWELVKLLGQAQDAFSPVVFDRYAAEGSRLAFMLEQNRPFSIQAFFHVQGGRADVYVLDEKGSLFHQTVEYYSEVTLVSQYQRFLDSAIRRCNAARPDHASVGVATQVEFQRLKKNHTGQLYAEPVRRMTDRGGEHYLSVQVIGDPTGDDPSAFTLFCQGREFSVLEYGDHVFTAAARHIVGQRGSGQHYPIYITDADVGRSQLGAEGALSVQTVHYLNYKKRIERELNDALARIRSQA